MRNQLLPSQACRVVGIHLVFSSLALLVGLACNADELAGSLRAYLAPPTPSGRATNNE